MLTLIAKVGLSVLMMGIAVADLRRHVVPLKLSLPLLLGGYLAAALHGAWGALLAGGATLFLSETWAPRPGADPVQSRTGLCASPRLGRARFSNKVRLGLGVAASAAGLWLSSGSPTSVLTTLAWAGAWLLWEANILGGGDAVVFIGLVGLFPDVRFVGLTLGVVIVFGMLMLVLRFGSAAFYLIPLAVKGILSLGQAGSLPSRAERDERGRPVAFMLALSGGMYLWFVGVGGL